MSNSASSNFSRHSASSDAPLPNLTLDDVRGFVLAYLKNEYSPNSAHHGPLSRHTSNFGFGVPIRFSCPPSHNDPRGRTMPPNHLRWVALGRHIRSHGQVGNGLRQAAVDLMRFQQLVRDARLPLGAIKQLSATIKDFSKIKRFSRIRTKLTLVGAWQALAARLLADQSTIAALFPPRETGFVMPHAEVETARRNLQAAGARVFSRVTNVADFEVRNLVKFQQRLPGIKALRGFEVDGHAMDAFELAENPRRNVWVHTHREYLAVEDLNDVNPGERFIRQLSIERNCNECHATHRHNVQLVVGLEEEMPQQGQLPAYEPPPSPKVERPVVEQEESPAVQRVLTLAGLIPRRR